VVQSASLSVGLRLGRTAEAAVATRLGTASGGEGTSFQQRSTLTDGVAEIGGYREGVYG